MDLTASEIRVLGCLIEKQRTTPDAYPLSVNALRLACNQTTNRDPVVSYDEEEIRGALARLRRHGFTRLAGAGRAAKYRHMLDEALHLDDGQMAVLAVLALRGEQTPGELKQRTERLHPFADLDEVLDCLGTLIERELAVRHERRPGQKEDRYTHTLGGEDVPVARAAVEPPREHEPEPDELAGLRAEVVALRAAVDALTARLDDLGG